MVGGCATVALAYVAGVRSAVGRHADAAVVHRAEQVSWPVRNAVHAVLSYATGPAAIAVVAVIAWRSWRGGRRDHACRAVVSVLSAALLTEILKVLLPRPGGENTLPSGHVTLLAAVAVAGALTAHGARRRWWAALGCCLASLAAVGTWIIGWHRPSDVVAAAGVVAICTGADSLLGRPWSPPGAASPRDHAVAGAG